jgi:hypothetical protein
VSRSPAGGAPGRGDVQLYVTELATEPRPVQMRLRPPGRAPVNLDMTPHEAHELGMGLINAADQARAKRREAASVSQDGPPGPRSADEAGAP